MPAVRAVFQTIIDSEEPLTDPIYGNRYRCASTLRDGTYLPCVVLQSRSKLVDLAKRRISEEKTGKGRIGGPDPYGQVVSSFVSSGNRVADYDIVAVEKSRFAIPQELLSRIHGETWMSWTGWVFEMTDGRLFSYGSTFSFEFFQMPEGYGFSDVRAVHNHSYVSATGEISPLPRGMPGGIPNDYDKVTIFRDRPYFVCNIDGI
jgi:hypothetical protein